MNFVHIFLDVYFKIVATSWQHIPINTFAQSEMI